MALHTSLQMKTWGNKLKGQEKKRAKVQRTFYLKHIVFELQIFRETARKNGKHTQELTLYNRPDIMSG